MHDRLQRILAQQDALSAGPRARRVARAPLRLATAKLLAAIARSQGRTARVTARTFWGDRMQVVLPEPLSLQVYRLGFYERGLTEFLLAYLRPCMTFFDVGAHYGYFTLLASRLVGDAGSVHAFEPSPSTFEVLTHNVRGRANVRSNPLAVWSQTTSIRLQDFGTCLSMYNSAFTPRLDERPAPERVSVLSVPATSIDDYVSSGSTAPDFVKIDAESAEHEVLAGMGGVILQHRPIITLEVGDFDVVGAPRSSELLKTVAAHDYVVMEQADGRIREHTIRQTYGYDNLLLLPR